MLPVAMRPEGQSTQAPGLPPVQPVSHLPAGQGLHAVHASPAAMEPAGLKDSAAQLWQLPLARPAQPARNTPTPLHGKQSTQRPGS